MALFSRRTTSALINTGKNAESMNHKHSKYDSFYRFWPLLENLGGIFGYSGAYWYEIPSLTH